MGRVDSRLDNALHMPLSRYDRLRVIVHAAGGGCEAAIRGAGGHIRAYLPFIKGYCVNLSAAGMGVLAHSAAVRFIEPDLYVRACEAQPCEAADTGVARAKGYDGRGVTIAIADTGIYPHADFLNPNRIVAFHDFIGGGTRPYDDNGHGTFCAGVAAGSGAASGGETVGVAPGANIAALKCIDAFGGGMTGDLLRAMQWVLDYRRSLNIRVFSMSLGAEQGNRVLGLALVSGVEMLCKSGVFVSVAAGNDGPTPGSINVPGNAPNAMTVGAVDARGERCAVAPFSSRGPAEGAQKPDIVAPGVALRATAADTSFLGTGKRRPSGYTIMTGTSMATPFIAGCAALLFQQNPSITPHQIKERLMSTAQTLGEPWDVQGSGLVDVAKALGM